MVLVGLTLAHLGYRFWERRTPADAVDVSTMMVGDPLPDLLIEVADGTCPHCRLAAQREAEGTSKARLPTTWVTDAGGPRLDAYRGLIHPDSRLGWAPEIYDQLRIQGVPAAFLVDSGGSLRQVWAYNGGREDHGELSVKCEGASHCGGVASVLRPRLGQFGSLKPRDRGVHRRCGARHPVS
jgi:hypothetical protein